MKRAEWLVVVVLSVLTVVNLSFAFPMSRGESLALSDVAVGPPATRQGASNLAQTMPSGVQETPPATPSRQDGTLDLNAVSRTTPTRADGSSTPPSSKTPTPTPAVGPTWTPIPTLSPSPFPFATHPDLPRFIFVDQGTQRMYVFERGKLRRDIPCSTGLPDDDKYTPAWTGKVGAYIGTFQSFGVFADSAWYLYQSAGGILVHSLPYLTEDGVKVYQDRSALGVRPSSHGCIRISPEDAVWLTAWNPQGVLMTVSDPYLEWWRK